jgi:hypothetical protein
MTDYNYKRTKFVEFNAYEGFSKEDLEEALIQSINSRASDEDSFDDIRYLLTSPYLHVRPDIHADEDTLLRKACRHNRLDVVGFILTSPELTEHADIHAREDYCIKTTCQHGYLELFKFLVTSPQLKETIDIHTQDDIAFRSAFTYEQVEILRYMIFDLNLIETAKMKSHYELYLNERENSNFCSKYDLAVKVKQMFEIRDLNNNLHNELSFLDIKPKKNKL